MKKKQKLFFISSISILLFLVSTLIYIEITNYNNLKRTPKYVAQQIVSADKFINATVDDAILFGDTILPYLENETHNYDTQYLYDRNIYMIAEILGSIKTEASYQIISMLYNRTDKLSKLLGIAGLVMQNRFLNISNEKSFLIQSLQYYSGRFDNYGDYKENHLCRELSAFILGLIKSPETVPYLIDELFKNQNKGFLNEQIYQALGEIGDTRAIIPIRKKFIDEKIDFLPTAFISLIKLKDKNAIPLAIYRIEAENNNNNYFLIKYLEKITDQKYGNDKNKWLYWWKENESKWIIPHKIIPEYRGLKGICYY